MPDSFVPDSFVSDNPADQKKERFFSGIHKSETGHLSNPYTAENPDSSAVGKYQFLWNQWGNQVSKFAGKPVSKEEYKNNPQLQEEFARHYYDKELGPQAHRLLKQYKQDLKAQGVTSLDEAKALIHFLGYPLASQWAQTGTLPESVAQKNLAVSDYLQKAREAWGKYDKSKQSTRTAATPTTKKVQVGNIIAEVPQSELNRLIKDWPLVKILE